MRLTRVPKTHAEARRKPGYVYECKYCGAISPQSITGWIYKSFKVEQHKLAICPDCIKKRKDKQCAQ